MKLRKVVGALLLASPVILLICIMTAVSGVKVTLLVLGSFAVLVGVVTAGVYLLAD